MITQVLAVLVKHELIDLRRIAQDGTRVRASARAVSFRREATLATLMAEARAHLEAVTREGLTRISRPAGPRPASAGRRTG